MRKFQAALCGLLILCGTLAFAAAGDVNSSYVTQENAQANFVALTATGNTATFDVGKALPSNHAVLAVVTGGPATCTISLQGTIDGVTWDTISNATTCTSSVYFYVSGKPMSGIRASLTVLSGGTSPTVTVFYTGTHGASSNSNVQGNVLGGVSGVGTNPVVVGGCSTVTSGACNSNAITLLVDSSGRAVTVGGGGGNGITQSNPIYIIPNATAQATCCATTPLVIAALTTATNIKASSGALYWIQGTNTNASACYLQLFDVVSGSVTLGTTTPKMVVSLGVAIGSSGTATMSPIGLYFSSTGLSVAATTTPTGASTCATGVVVSAIAS